MATKFRNQYRTGVTVFISCLLGVAGWLIFTRGPNLSETNMGSSAGIRVARNETPRLVSIDPMPVMEGEMCETADLGARSGTEMQSISGSGDSILEIAAQRPPAIIATSSADDKSSPGVNSDRAPVRVIEDTYPTYSAIAVDTRTNEVFLEDENLFGLKVFNRLDDTPPGAGFTEPQRVLGGIKTKLEFNCGLYVDPKSGDVYSVANDTVDTMVVFPRDAKGNVQPMRELKTPHGTYGVAVDEGAGELYLTVEHNNAVVVYPKMASGNTQPLRDLEGDHTRLEDPHGIAVDTKNHWMFVSNHGNAKNRKIPGSGKFEPPSITVYPLKASGDTPPLRVIQGPQTQLDWPAAIYLDQENGELYVANDAADSILVFHETDSGDQAPFRVVKGPRTGIKNPTGLFVDTKNQELWVSNMGNHSATVFPIAADGNAPPLRVIRSAPAGKLALAIGNPGGAGYDSKREEILVPN